MKRVKISLVWLLSLLMIAFISCKKDDNGTTTPPVEDGIYLSGTATGLTGLDLNGILEPGREEGTGFASLLRTGMYEKYMYLVAGEFNVVVVAGTSQTSYGWGTHGTRTLDGAGDLIVGTIDTGEVVVDGTAFVIAHDGFYHIVYDNTSTSAYITEINDWGLIGDATDLGWSGQFAMTEKTMTATACAWEITNQTLRATGGFKFRYNDGWKSNGDGFIFFTNIGKSDVSSDFMTGGGGFPYPTDAEGAFTVTLNWSLADGFSYTTVRTGDVEPLPEYPAALYMIGNGLNSVDGDLNGTPDGWQWELTDAPMVPVNSHPNLFWKIVWLEAAGEIKFAPAKEWNGDFGKDGDVSADTVWTKGSQNIPVPGTAGYYMVVVDLAANLISFAEPKVYLLGDCVGGYTISAANKFTIDNANEKLTITKALSTGDLRICSQHKFYPLQTPTTADWWQSEFIVLSNVIEFRGTGGDQTRVPLTAGTFTIDLNFKTGAGAITPVTK